MMTHWGTFNKATGINPCHAIAQGALTAEGFGVQDTTADGQQFLLGVDAQAMVTVFLEPVGSGETRVTVAAYSDDSAAAESARNRVRSQIVNG